MQYTHIYYVLRFVILKKVTEKLLEGDMWPGRSKSNFVPLHVKFSFSNPALISEQPM